MTSAPSATSDMGLPSKRKTPPLGRQSCPRSYSLLPGLTGPALKDCGRNVAGRSDQWESSVTQALVDSAFCSRESAKDAVHKCTALFRGVLLCELHGLGHDDTNRCGRIEAKLVQGES